MPALLGLLIGALLGHQLAREWGATIGGLLGFFAGVIVTGQRERSALRGTLPASPPTDAAALAARVAALERRVAELEGRHIAPAPEGGSAAAPRAEEVPVTAERARAATPPGTVASTDAQQQSLPPPPPPRATDASARPVPPRAPNALWAWFTGGNAITRIGVVVLFFGVAFLLRYFAEHFTVPLAVRLALVALGGVVLIGLGMRVARMRPAYGWALQAAGTGVLYLTTYAAYREYDLLPGSIALALLVVIAALTIALALYANAEVLAGLALAGAFLAPLLTESDTSVVPLFGYFAVLDAVVVVIASTRTWRAVAVLGFVFTFALGLFWGARFYEPAYLAEVEPFLLIYLAMYVTVALLHARRDTSASAHPGDALLLFGPPLVAFSMQAALVRDTRFGTAWSALALAALYAGLGRWAMRRTAQTAGMARLSRAALALAIVFVTLAVPFAFDHRVTAAVWALEGALVFWFGSRHGTPATRLFGWLVQFAAGILFAAEHGARESAWVPDAYVVGALLIGAAGLGSAWLADTMSRARGPREDAIVPVIFVWGALWWIAVAGWEIVRPLAGDVRAHAALAWVVLSTGLALAVNRMAHWPRALGLVAALPATMLLVALADLRASDTTLLHGGWMVWPVAWVVLFAALRQTALFGERDAAYAVPRWLDTALTHAGVAVALTAHLAWEASEWVARITADDTVWTACAAALPAIIALGVMPRLVSLRAGPFARHREAYVGGAARVIATVLIAWIVAVNALSPGEPFPLPYVPLANPLDLTLALALVALTAWGARHTAIETRRGIALLGALIFVCVNGVLLRTAHHWLHLPWELGALLASRPLQAALTLAWTGTGALLMLLATRRRLRTVWMVGAVLLAIVLVKLFAVDLAALTGLPRVVAFLGVGAVLLAIGYVSPLPPADDVAAERSHDGGAAETDPP